MLRLHRPAVAAAVPAAAPGPTARPLPPGASTHGWAPRGGNPGVGTQWRAPSTGPVAWLGLRGAAPQRGPRRGSGGSRCHRPQFSASPRLRWQWGRRPHGVGWTWWDVADPVAGSGLLHPSAPRPFSGGGSRATPHPAGSPSLPQQDPHHHQHPRAPCQPSPTPCQHRQPHPSSTARRGAEARRLGQGQNLRDRFPKSCSAVLGSGARASTKPPPFSRCSSSSSQSAGTRCPSTTETSRLRAIAAAAAAGPQTRRKKASESQTGAWLSATGVKSD